MTTLHLPIKTLAAVAAMVKADNYGDIEFKLRTLETLYNLLSRETVIDTFDILAHLEDFADYRSDDDIFRLLNEIRFLEQREGQYRLRDEVYLNQVLDMGAGRQGVSLILDELQTIGPRQPAKNDSEESVAATLGRTAAHFNAIAAAGAADPEITCLPIFWQYESAQYRPHFEDNASTASLALIETLGLLQHLLPIEQRQRAAHSRRTLLERCIARIDQASPVRPEDAGAFYLADDDDYPGAERPANCSNALLLGLLLPEPDYRDQVIGIVNFLKCTQLENGGFGMYILKTYSYPPEPFVMLEVVGNLCALLQYAHFTEEEKQPARYILRRCQAYLLASAVERESHNVWCRSDNPDRWDLYATAQNALALLHLRDDATRDRAITALRFALDNWRLDLAADDPGNFEFIQFRSLTAAGPALGNVSWKQEGLAKLLLLFATAFVRYDLPLTVRDLDKLSAAARLLCNRAVDGYWQPFGMPGVIHLFNTSTAAKALLAYHRALHKFILGS